MSEETASRVREHVRGGGKVFVTYASGISDETTATFGWAVTQERFATWWACGGVQSSR